MEFNMDVIDKARELGALIQRDARYAAYVKAKEESDGDSGLQMMIREFNLKRLQLNGEMTKPDKDSEKLNGFDADIKKLYAEIMDNPNMKAFNAAKDEMDDMLSQINAIITFSANGEDPSSCPSCQAGGCAGSCASCGGCG